VSVQSVFKFVYETLKVLGKFAPELTFRLFLQATLAAD
jgi:hypothetical protein